jgi:hypothetical protein
MRSAADLPDDIDELKRRLIAAEAGLLAKTLEAEKLKFELARLKRMSFGASSERIEREIEQLELRLEEIETTVAGASMAEAPEPDPAPAASPEKKPPLQLSPSICNSAPAVLWCRCTIQSESPKNGPWSMVYQEGEWVSPLLRVGTPTTLRSSRRITTIAAA